MNAYDEQAIEAALRMRDGGASFTLAVVSIGADPTAILKHAAALGADEIAAIPLAGVELDGHAIARLLAAYVRASGGADLVLCGRQASDDDQGVVPALLGELLDVPVVTVARAVDLSEGRVVRVTRVTPEGDERVEADCPAIVTISNELGEPRYPTAKDKLAARRRQPDVFDLARLSLAPDDLRPRVSVLRQVVPVVQGQCEFLGDGTPAELAERLIERLRAENVIA
jgi:electron transfer flavoprotein beta subunit